MDIHEDQVRIPRTRLLDGFFSGSRYGEDLLSHALKCQLKIPSDNHLILNDKYSQFTCSCTSNRKRTLKLVPLAHVTVITPPICWTSKRTSVRPRDLSFGSS